MFGKTFLGHTLVRLVKFVLSSPLHTLIFLPFPGKSIGVGGMPERLNGAVSKTVVRF
jgi:hypothetical protein